MGGPFGTSPGGGAGYRPGRLETIAGQIGEPAKGTGYDLANQGGAGYGVSTRGGPSMRLENAGTAEYFSSFNGKVQRKRLRCNSQPRAAGSFRFQQRNDDKRPKADRSSGNGLSSGIT